MGFDDFVADSIINGNTGDVTLFIIINVLITAIAYLILPLISKFKDKEVYTKKDAIKAAALNSLMVFILFRAYHLIFFSKLDIDHISTAIFYTIISYCILISNKNKNMNITDKKTEKENETQE